MNQIRSVLTFYSQSVRSKIVSALLLAGTVTVLFVAPALAAGTPYGTGPYGSDIYNGSTPSSSSSSSSSSGAPNTGAGTYTFTNSNGSPTKRTFYNWVELAGGVLLVAIGAGIFVWVLPRRKHHGGQQ